MDGGRHIGFQNQIVTIINTPIYALIPATKIRNGGHIGRKEQRPYWHWIDYHIGWIDWRIDLAVGTLQYDIMD